MQGVITCTRCNIRRGMIRNPHRSVAISSSYPRFNHYKVLGLKQSAKPHEIRAAYISLSKKLHPDVNPENPDIHEDFVELKEAYEILKSPILRSEYDIQLASPPGVRMHPGMRVYRKPPPDPFSSEREFREYNEFNQNYDEHSEEATIFRRTTHNNVLKALGVFMVVGLAVHMMMFEGSRRYVQSHLDEKDRRIAAIDEELKSPSRIERKKQEMEHVLRQSKKGRELIQNKLKSQPD